MRVDEGIRTLDHWIHKIRCRPRRLRSVPLVMKLLTTKPKPSAKRANRDEKQQLTLDFRAFRGITTKRYHETTGRPLGRHRLYLRRREALPYR